MYKICGAHSIRKKSTVRAVDGSLKAGQTISSKCEMMLYKYNIKKYDDITFMV